MVKTIVFVVVIVAVIVVALLYVNDRPLTGPSSLDDATKTDRCAEFRDAGLSDENDYSLGYGGRIRQLVRGCF